MGNFEKISTFILLIVGFSNLDSNVLLEKYCMFNSSKFIWYLPFKLKELFQSNRMFGCSSFDISMALYFVIGFNKAIEEERAGGIKSTQNFYHGS